ncbi:MAG TPA: 3-hydroxyacyl-CoA dehydrogenase NAD-binding domain-containing protein, partial [Xanthobacteraceae bacterium]|nr:3-hydroxyacyl-CoA dehydrogenase NAD-binding domain-containing protein [Xanthobacteraceae bacterium]
ALGATRRITDRPVPPADESAVAAAADAAIRKGRSRPAIVESVAAVRRASALPTSEALRVERATFQQLRESEEAAALRYLFFAERAALRAVAPVAEARTVRAVGVIGAGTMGAGIAAAFIDAGLAAWLIDVDDAAVARGLSRVRETEDRAVRTGRIAQADADARLARLRPSTRLADIAGADLVIEAVFEDIDAKTAVLRDVAAATAAGTIIASNTSYLDLDVLAAATPRPTDVVGLHFFAPANVMRLVEVVRGKATSDAAFSAAFSVVKRLGKLPIVSGVCEGFIGNRLYSAYRMQCEFMLEEGCLPAQVDAALEAFGFAMGPFAVGDLSGLDIAWRNRKRLAASRDPRSRYAPALDRLCEMGRFGRKAGAGWYAYAAPDSEKAPDPIVHALIEQIARDKGIARRAFSDAEIVTRAMGALVNEAALLLAEGITSRPADIDLVMVNGFGFPKHRGGPVFWATRLPRAEVERAVDQVEAAAGHGFRRGNLDLVLRPTPTRD